MITPVALTPTQQRIWTAQRLSPHVPLANMANRFHLTDAIDSDRLVAAFDRVVDRCDVLRMAVVSRSAVDPPAALVRPRTKPATSVIEMPRADVDAWVADRVSRPLDATTCVYDSVLVQHEDGTTTWWLCLHHVATDAWTSALIFEATAAAYEHGPDADLSEIIDGDYFSSAAHSPTGSGHHTDNDHDVAERAAIEPVALYGGSGARSTAIVRREVSLDDEFRQRLDAALAGQYRTLSSDLSTLALSAMAVAQLVNRMDGRTSVVLDTPLHHRSSRRTKRLVGPLMEIAPLDVVIDPSDTNAAMFKRVVRSIMALLAQPRSTTGQQRLTSGLLVNVVTARYGDFAGVPTTREWVRAAHVDATQAIGSQVFETVGADAQARLRWEVEVPAATSGHELDHHVATILADIVDRPDSPIGNASIITEREADNLAQLNPSPAPRPLGSTVHEQVAAALRERPDWVVAEHNGATIDAARFDNRVEQLARWLRVRGVDGGTTVAIELGRGIDLLIAVHAVMRSGGVFVLLDPAGPTQRRAAILDDAGIDIVIDELPVEDAAFDSSADVGVDVDLDDIAYILFTSGSTGRPKGVPISHRGLADYLAFAVESFGLDEPVVALHSSVEFDLTITSLFASFMSGGRTVVFDQEPIEALAAIAADDRIDTLKATPSQLTIYTRLAEPDRGLRTVIVGGEAFRRPTAVELLACCRNDVRIFNEYGPTEAVVGCMVHEWDPAVDVDVDVPIGAAAPGAAVAVLDRAQQWSPVGAWGELYVRRPGMADGYLDRPEESAERFVEPAVLAAVAPGPWYRTGDRVRVERPGVLVYGGRIDDQLKVKGYRLEPAEVEAALTEHPAVVAAVVRLAPSETAAEVLTAWFETVEGSEIGLAELRMHCRRRLADHAVPQAFVRIDEMPLAASAKADASLLPAPGVEHRSDVHVEPAGQVESSVAEVWCTVLGIDRVGATDDFFEIGGASLSSIEVVATLDDRYGTALADASLFTARTVRQLAALIEQQLAAPAIEDRRSRAVIEPLEPGTPVPLSSSEEAMLFDHRRDPASTHYHVARLYRLDGLASLDTTALRSAFEAVVAHHEPLHTSYAAGRPVLSTARAFAWSEHAPMSGDDFDALAVVSRARPFDLDSGPLVRVDLAQTADEQWSLLICLHHISLGVGTLDLIWQHVVDVFADGALPELPVSYGAHAAWQRAHDDDAARRAWLDRAVARPEPEPIRLAPPPAGTPDGYVARELPIDASQLSVHGRTPFSAAFAAAAITLTQFTASGHAEFGVAASTKDHVDATDLIGHHLNSLPIGLTVDCHDTFEVLLDRATEAATSALAIRTYPFASIVRDARSAGHVAPDLAFMLAYDEMAPASFPGAEVQHRILPSETAVTDVTFFVQERPGSVQLSIEYRGTVIDRIAAQRLLDVFVSTLLEGTANPASTVAALTAPEPRSELVGQPGALDQRHVIDRFADAVLADGDAPAVIDAHGIELSRRRLLGRALEIADGVDAIGPATRCVGVLVGRGVDVLPALFGVQLAGCAAVPLDPTVGVERLRSIVTESGLDVVVHDATLAADDDGSVLGIDATQCFDVRRTGADVAVDADAELGEPSSSDQVAMVQDRLDRLDSDDLAYIVFTSGSTGVPRGVGVTHGNLAASTAARTPWYAAAPDRFLVTSSIGFDSSVVGLYWPLATGGTVVMPSDDDVHDVDRLGRIISDREVSHILMVPTLYRALLDRASDLLGSLDTVIVAGESGPVSLVDRHHEELPGVALVNEYGPTEATVWATAHQLVSGQPTAPIGRPIPGVEVRIVGAAGAPVPVGVAGELWIAGPTVTPGYFNQPDATAERFAEVDGRRWYRTGDRVRIVDDVIDFVGRLDDQLNVGGVRVEPIDVETQLRRLDAVEDAVVVAATTAIGPMLVAHVVTADPVNESTLRDHLIEHLPTAAVPSRFIRQAALPLSANGKVDRRAAAALPTSTEPATKTVQRADTAAMTGGLVADVVHAWNVALDRMDIAPETDFFAIGGNSLAAVEIVTRLADITAGDVPIATLITGRTPAGVAALIETSVSSGTSRCQAVTLREGAASGPLVLMVPAWDEVFGYQALADAFGDDVSVVALVHVATAGAPGVDNIDELVEGFTPLAQEAAASREAVAVLGWSVGGIVAVELAAALAADGLDVRPLALVDTLYPGEGRHLWSNRWWKYKSMLKPGSFGAAVAEFVKMGTRRIGPKLLTAWRRVLPGAAPTTAAASPAVGASGVFPPESLEHEVGSVAVPLVFYAATGTNPDRTTAHWSVAAADLDVVTVAGRHRGVDSIMSRPGVDVIAADLSTRL